MYHTPSHCFQLYSSQERKNCQQTRPEDGSHFNKAINPEEIIASFRGARTLQDMLVHSNLKSQTKNATFSMLRQHNIMYEGSTPCQEVAQSQAKHIM